MNLPMTLHITFCDYVMDKSMTLHITFCGNGQQNKHGRRSLIHLTLNGLQAREKGGGGGLVPHASLD